MAAADRQPSARRALYRHLRLFLRLFLFRVRAHRDLRAGLLHAAGFHRRPADVPAGDGAVAARAPILFWTNVVLVVYTMWGYLSPLDFFWHPGTTFYRVVTSSTVEFSTGIYGLYGQLALTLIAAFLLLAGVANGFEAQRAMINVVRLIAGRSRQLIPQTAVVGSSAIGMISGSRLGQRRRGRHHHHPADDALRRARHVRRRGRDLGLDGRPDHAADDGGRRLPDVGIPRRALLGRRDARLRARLRLLRVDRRRGLSAVRAAAAARPDREAAGAALRQGQDHDLFLLRALSALPDGLRRQGRTARRALHRDLHVRPAGRGLSLLQVRGEGPGARQARRCSATRGSRSRPTPR